VIIPSDAPDGSTYSVGVKFPSGTADAFQQPVVFKTLEDRTITVSNLPYVVGDSAIATWYSAGEFGNTNLNNNDVNNTFYAAIGARLPFKGTDLFDAMDVSPEDSAGQPAGDGVINVADWQVVFDRAVRLNTNNWKRVRFLTTTVSDNRSVSSLSSLGSAPLLPAAEVAGEPTTGPAWTPDVKLSGDQVGLLNPGDTVSVPVRLQMEAGVAVAGLMFRASVEASADAPAIAGPVQFVPAQGMTPSISVPVGPASVACGWLVGSFPAPLSGSGTLGSLQFAIPVAAKAGQHYTIRFSFTGAISAKNANGRYINYRVGSLPGSAWVLAAAQQPPDVIPDEWRVRFFGAVNHWLGRWFDDPDGDGQNNLQEFMAGTNPVKLRLHVLLEEWRARRNGFALKWFAQAGKTYLIQSALDPVSGPWTTVAEIGGETDRSDLKEYLAPLKDAPRQFYRIIEKP